MVRIVQTPEIIGGSAYMQQKKGAKDLSLPLLNFTAARRHKLLAGGFDCHAAPGPSTALSVESGLERQRADCDICRYVTCRRRRNKNAPPFESEMVMESRRWTAGHAPPPAAANCYALGYTKLPRQAPWLTASDNVVYSQYWSWAAAVGGCRVCLILNAWSCCRCVELHTARLWNPYRLIHSPICIVRPLIVDAVRRLDRHRRLL